MKRRKPPLRPSRLSIVIASILLGSGAGIYAEEENLTVNTATLESEGDELGAGSESSSLDQIFKLQKDLMRSVLRQAGIDFDSLPPETKAALSKPQTTSLPAFFAFAEGLELLDEGQFAKAQEQFRQAAELDPEFELAARYRDATPTIPQEPADVTNDALQRTRTTDSAVTPLTTPRDPEWVSTVTSTEPPPTPSEPPLGVPDVRPDETGEDTSEQTTLREIENTPEPTPEPMPVEVPTSFISSDIPSTIIDSEFPGEGAVPQ